MQGFNWESSKEDWYVKITKQAAGFAEVGYTAVWMPPPSDAVSPEGYLPRDLYDLNSGFGSESELRDCIAVLKENNLTVVADIVINHRCAPLPPPRSASCLLPTRVRSWCVQLGTVHCMRRQRCQLHASSLRLQAVCASLLP